MTSRKILRDAKKESYLSSRSIRSLTNEDDQRLKELGYEPQLERHMHAIDSLALTLSVVFPFFGPLTLIGLAIQIGGTVPSIVNWIITSIGMLCIAGVFAELAALFPTCGSIYYWAYRTGGEKYGALFAYMTATCNILGFFVALASVSVGITNFILTEVSIFNPSFTTDTSTITFRAIQFGGSLLLLGIACVGNLISQSKSIWLIRSIIVVFIWFIVINFIYLPIAVAFNPNVSFNSPSFVFTTLLSGNGLNNESYNWFANFLLPIFSILGFEGAAHVSEETKFASRASANAVFRGCFYCCCIGLGMIIVLLFTFNVNSTTLSLSPMPIIGMYLDIMGQANQLIIIIFTIIGLFIGLMYNFIYGLSRFLFAASRDGFVPIYFSQINETGVPITAVLGVFIGTSVFLCLVLVDQYVFGILTGASAQMWLFSYFFVIIGRLTFTSSSYKQSADWNLGAFSFPVAVIAICFIIFFLIVLSLPVSFPITPQTFNYSPFISLFLLFISITLWHLSVKFTFKGLGNQTDEKLNKKFMERTGSFLSSSSILGWHDKIKGGVEEVELKVINGDGFYDENGLRLRSPNRRSPRLVNKNKTSNI